MTVDDVWNGLRRGAMVLGSALLLAGVASAATVPFTEEFVADNAGWEDGESEAATFVASGGPDGSSYASVSFNYFGFESPFGGGPVVVRAASSDGASGGALFGDWIADDVDEVSMWVRHDTGVDLQFFIRVATAFNFPGAVIGGDHVVPSGVWTEIVFPVDPDDPACVGETITCAEALADVGNFQIGTDAPEVLTLTDMAFAIDVDGVHLAAVPEPGAVGMMLLGVGVLAAARIGRRPQG